MIYWLCDNRNGSYHVADATKIGVGTVRFLSLDGKLDQRPVHMYFNSRRFALSVLKKIAPKIQKKDREKTARERNMYIPVNVEVWMDQ